MAGYRIGECQSAGNSSALGQTRSWRHVRVESVLPPTSDIGRRRWHGSFVPREATYAPQQTAPLFDHLVGSGDNREWHFETERPRGLEIDDQLDFGELLHRQIGRLLTF